MTLGTNRRLTERGNPKYPPAATLKS